MMPGGIVLIVGTETTVVEADLTAGRLACPGMPVPAASVGPHTEPGAATSRRW